MALAERARSEGTNPAAMCIWLLKNKCFDRITQAYEDAARQRLRSLYEDPDEGCRQVDEHRNQQRKALEFSEEDRIVVACLQTSQKTRFEPHVLARELKGWSREQWDEQLLAYNQRQFSRWQSVDPGADEVWG